MKWRIFLHTIFLVVAFFVAASGTLTVGVQEYGDNPGAALAGISIFLLAYLALVFIESITIARKFSRTEALTQILVSLLSSFAAFEVTWHLGIPILGCGLPPFLVGGLACASFLTAECTVELTIKWLIGKRRRASDIG